MLHCGTIISIINLHWGGSAWQQEFLVTGIDGCPVDSVLFQMDSISGSESFKVQFCVLTYPPIVNVWAILDPKAQRQSVTSLQI